MTINMRGSPGGDSPAQHDPTANPPNTTPPMSSTTSTVTTATTTASLTSTSSSQIANPSEEMSEVPVSGDVVYGPQQVPVQHDETGGGDNTSAANTVPDKPPSPMLLADDEEPDFPFNELAKLDEMINRPRWVVPVLPNGELEVLLDAAINLSKKELDTRSEACQRFFRDGLTISFTKILTDEAVSGWKYEIHRCIYNNSVKLIELCVVKLPHDWFPLLDLLAMVLNPSSKFHMYNGNRSSETVLAGAQLADDELFARPDARMPKGWLVDLVNTFGKLGGFALLLERFTGPGAASLSVPVIAALLRPFGLCYEVLTAHVVETYFMPVVELVLKYLENLTDDELKKDSKTEAKNDALSGIIKSLKCLASRVPKQEETIKGLEIFRLKMILRLLQISSFNGKMNALNEVNKVITNVSYYTHRHGQLEEDEWLTAEKMAEWVQQNNVLSIVLRDSLHQPQYVEKLEKIIRFMIKEKALTRQDLNRIWEAQAGKHEAIVKNVHDLLAKLAWDFSHDQLDHLFDCFQASWANATKKQREKLLELIRRLAEDDKEGVMAQKVLGLLWNLAHSEDVPTEIMDLALSAHIKILDYSCSQDRDSHKMQWIKKFVEELKNDKWVLPALKQIKEICSLFTEAPQNLTHSQRQSHMYYRNQVITQLQNQNSIVMLVAQNLNAYMAQARIYAKEHPDEDPSNILPDGRFNHIMQVNERLKFLRFLLKDGQLWLCEPQAKQIWMCLAESAIHPCDRENCFKWFSKLMGEEPDLDPEITKDFFEANILQFDPSLLTENGMMCFERFFKSVNSKEGKLIAKRRGGYMMDDLDLIGLDYLWRVVLYSPDEVADKAIVLLKDVYTNLGPRLHCNQAAIHEDFLQVCTDRLRAAYDTISALDRDKDSVNRIQQEAGRMIRVVTVLREYISECDDAYSEERSILPLGRASRGKHMNLSVRFPNQGRQIDDIDIWSHSNDTLGAVRRHIDRCIFDVFKDLWLHTPLVDMWCDRVKGSNANIKVDLFLNGELLDQSEDRKLVSALGIRDKTLLTAKLGQVGSNMPSSPDSSSDSSAGSPHHNTYDGPNIEAENCLPGVLMASNPRNAQFLFQLADLGCELELPKLREGVRNILKLMPADTSTMDKLREVCQESTKAGSPSESSSTYSKLEAMYFDVSASQALYNLEVAYALLMPAHNPMSEEAFEFQYNYLKSGGVTLALNMLTKNNFIPNADINSRRSAYHWALKTTKLLLTAVGYAQVQMVADACQSDSGSAQISQTVHKQALVLQSAQQYIPHPSTECMTRSVAMKLGHCLGDQATGQLPDLNAVQCLQKIAWSTSSGSLDLVHATMEDIHQAHEKTSANPQTSPVGGSPNSSKVPDTEDVAVCREALEVLSVSLALCPQALEVLNKDKAWQTFIIDLLLLCRSRSVRVSASDQFNVMATRCCAGHRPLLFFITLLFTVLGTTAKDFAKQSHEYFQLLCRLLNYAYICSASLPTAEVLLNNEIVWLKKIRDNVMKTGEMMVEEALLEGHLGITKELLSLQTAEKKYHIGSEKGGQNLIKEIVEDFIFPASKIVIKCRKSKGELSSDQAIPVCGAPSTIIAAFDLLVALCTGCVQNLRTLSHMLTEMYYSAGQETQLQEWEYVPPVGPRPPKGFVGLKNAGATCYMNSVLQQLFMIDPIRTCILGAEGAVDENMEEEEIEEKGENETNTDLGEERNKEDPSKQNGDSRTDYHNGVLKHVQVIFAHLACSKLQYYVPSGFWKHFRLWGEPVNLREQHDALEFFNSTVDSLDEALKALKYTPIVSKVMGGTFADQKICKGCPHRYSREESFTALNVDIRNHQNLLESLEQYVKGDLLEGANAYHCDKCNKKVDTVKRMCIKKLPPILAMQLKRFDYDWERECAIKFNDYFEFPREVDMDPYTVQGLARIEGELITEDGEQIDKPQSFCTKYRLVGVVVHSGQASGGHYYSYILHRVGEQMPRWYKFDDGEVSECKMEDDEEMKNQCFGGEYMGEVFDHMLKRMSYRRQKRWWNAYILIYERMEEYDAVIQKDTLTLTRSMQDLTITNKTSQVKMPAAIERCVRRQNIQYMHNKTQFSPEYFQFMKKLLTCNAFNVQPLQGQERPSPEAEELASISVQLASKFLFDVGFHTKKTLRGPAQEWYDALSIHLRHSRTVRNWFAQNVLFSRPSRFAEYLLECPSTEVRNAFVKILVFLAHFSLQDEPTASPHKPGLMVEGSMSLSQSILSAVLGLLNKEVSEHGRHLTSYFHLFCMYANLGLREKQQLLQLGVPGKLMQVALDEGPGPPIKYQYTELGKLYAVVSVLIRCCDVSARCVSSSPTAQMPAPNPHGEPSISEPLMTIQSDVADLLYGRPSYVKKLIEDCNNAEETTKLLKFCSWENPHFSSTVLSELLWQVAYSYTYELRPYLDLLLQMLLLEDSWQNHRIHNALKGIPDDRDGLFDTIQRSKNHYQKRAYQCIKMMVSLFTHCAPASQMLQSNTDLKRKWAFAVGWLNDELERRPYSGNTQYTYNNWSPPAQSNETSNGYFLERSHSAKVTLQRACELCPDEEGEEEVVREEGASPSADDAPPSPSSDSKEAVTDTASQPVVEGTSEADSQSSLGKSQSPSNKPSQSSPRQPSTPQKQSPRQQDGDTGEDILPAVQHQSKPE